MVTPRIGMLDHEPLAGMAQAKAARARTNPAPACASYCVP